jgi:hypothetical protein
LGVSNQSSSLRPVATSTDIEYPPGFIPPYQDEDDEFVLPTNTHPSYPFGNPYAPTATSVLPGSKPPAARWSEFALEDLLPFEDEPEPPGTVGGVNEGTAHEEDQVPAHDGDENGLGDEDDEEEEEVEEEADDDEEDDVRDHQEEFPSDFDE